jgi:predicted dehydrogenase
LEKTINVALTAYGMSGQVFHAPLLTSHPGFKLKKVVERRTQKSSAAYPFVEVVRDYEALLADTSIDLIVVNTPNSLHYEQARRALEAGKHVVVEKPFTVTSQEAKDLISYAQAQNKLLSVFQNRRWDGDFLTVRQVVENKLLGQLVEFEAHYDRYRNFVEANTWKEETGPGSGILYNLGSHMIDQALVLFGMPKSVTADIRVQRPGGKIDDSYDIRMNYEDMRVVLKSSYLVREPGPRYIIHGTDGTFMKYGIDPQEDALKTGGKPTDKNWGVEPTDFWGTINTQLNNLHVTGQIETLPGNYLKYYESVYQAIVAGKPLAVQAQEAMQGIHIIEAAMESSRTQQTVVI